MNLSVSICQVPICKSRYENINIRIICFSLSGNKISIDGIKVLRHGLAVATSLTQLL